MSQGGALLGFVALSGSLGREMLDFLGFKGMDRIPWERELGVGFWE